MVRRSAVPTAFSLTQRVILRSRTHFSQFLVLAILMSCSSPPDDIFGVDHPTRPAASVSDASRHTIFIATTRQEADDPAVLYSTERKPLSLNLASVEVQIPPNHVSGKIERAKSVPPDPRSDVMILEPQKYQSGGTFRSSVNKHLAQLPAGSREIMLFVHGFNTDIASAVLRAAQIKHDSGFTGLAVVFSWASRGKALSYVYDLNSALHARDDLLTTTNLLMKTRTEGVSVVAHSMGNLLTVEAMRQAQLLGDFNKSGKLGSIILASPDVDADLFKKQVQVFPKNQRKFYVLVSEDDKALAFSRKIAGGVDRVGDSDAEELEKLGVIVIDLSQVEDESRTHHSKFAESPEIVQLIGNRLNAGDQLGETSKMGLLKRLPAATQILTDGPGSGRILIFN